MANKSCKMLQNSASLCSEGSVLRNDPADYARLWHNGGFVVIGDHFLQVTYML